MRMLEYTKAPETVIVLDNAKKTQRCVSMGGKAADTDIEDLGSV
jgi:hypothetical protein